jgi:hypothetical protein
MINKRMRTMKKKKMMRMMREKKGMTECFMI